MSASAQRKKHAGHFDYSRYGYFFAAPFLIGLVVFVIYPLAYTLVISFSDLQGFASSKMNFIGLSNYRMVLKSPFFGQTLQNTVIMWGVSALLQYPMQLLVAFWFSNKRLAIKGQPIYKFMIYMPSMIGQMAVGVVFCALFAYPGGTVNKLLMSLGFIEKDINFLGMTSTLRGLVSYVDFWYFWGGGMLITLAAMTGVNPALYEAAEIDGANGRQSFIHITLPSIKKVLTYIYVTGAIGGLQMYGIPYLLGGMSDPTGGMLKTGRTTAIWIRELAFSNEYKYGRAAAASFLLFLIIGAISVILLIILRDKDSSALAKPNRRKQA